MKKVLEEGKDIREDIMREMNNNIEGDKKDEE